MPHKPIKGLGGIGFPLVNLVCADPEIGCCGNVTSHVSTLLPEHGLLRPLHEVAMLPFQQVVAEPPAIYPTLHLNAQT